MVSTNIKFKFLQGERAFGGFKQFEGVQPAVSNDTDGIASNGKFVALPWNETSTLAVFPAYDFKRFDANIPLITGHHGNVLDVQFAHHNDNLLASCSEDATIKLWLLEDEAMTENRSKADGVLKGHTKKVLGFQWHTIAENTIASYSYDNTVRIWDVEQQANTITYEGIEKVPTSLRWNPSANQVGLPCKGGNLLFLDPRKEGSAIQSKAHASQKSQKLAWIDDTSFITSGFSKQAEREFMVWDQRNLTEAVSRGSLGSSSGVAHITFDQQHHLMYMAGRGDSVIGIYQYTQATTTLAHLTDFNISNTPQKGFNLLPKWANDVQKHEIGRGVRCTNKGTIEFIGFRLPNKTGQFNQDLYPKHAGQTPGNTYAEWASGVDKPAILSQLSPDGTANAEEQTQRASFLNKLKGAVAASAQSVQAASAAPSKELTALKAELAQANSQIEELKAHVQVAEEAASQQTAPVTESVEDFSTKPLLGYWNSRGAGQQIRYMFAYLNVDFEDNKYDIGPAPEFDRSSWFNVKFDLGFDYPNLPHLIDGHTKLTETVGIMKYIAKKWDPSLLGSNAGQFGHLEMLSAHVGELKTKATMPCYMSQDGDKTPVVDECRPIHQQLVEQLGDKNWFLGDQLSWLDFVWAEVIDLLDFLSDGKFYEEFPTTKAYWERFISLPHISEYWADDDKCMKKPFHGIMARINNI